MLGLEIRMLGHFCNFSLQCACGPYAGVFGAINQQAGQFGPRSVVSDQILFCLLTALLDLLHTHHRYGHKFILFCCCMSY